MKLIKIKDDHYVVVTDKPIKWKDYFLNTIQKEVYCHDIENYDVNKYYLKKITYSTQPLGVKPITDKVVIEENKDGKPLMSAQYVELDMSCTVKPLSLQEVKESFCWLDGTEWEVEIVDGKLKLK